MTVVLSAQGASGAFYPFLPFSDCSGFFEPYGGLQGWTLGFGSGVIQSIFPVIFRYYFYFYFIIIVCSWCFRNSYQFFSVSRLVGFCLFPVPGNLPPQPSSGLLVDNKPYTIYEVYGRFLVAVRVFFFLSV